MRLLRSLQEGSGSGRSGVQVCIRCRVFGWLAKPWPGHPIQRIMQVRHMHDAPDDFCFFHTKVIRCIIDAPFTHQG